MAKKLFVQSDKFYLHTTNFAGHSPGYNIFYKIYLFLYILFRSSLFYPRKGIDAETFFLVVQQVRDITDERFHYFYRNISRAIRVLSDHLIERVRPDRRVRESWIPRIRYARPIPNPRPIHPPRPAFPRGFSQITRICPPTLTFLVQQISIILAKSGLAKSDLVSPIVCESAPTDAWSARTAKTARKLLLEFALQLRKRVRRLPLWFIQRVELSKHHRDSSDVTTNSAWYSCRGIFR